MGKRQDFNLTIRLTSIPRTNNIFTNHDLIKGEAVVEVLNPVHINRIDVVFDGLIKNKVKTAFTTDGIYRVLYLKQKVYPAVAEKEENLTEEESNCKEFFLPVGTHIFPFDFAIATRNIEYNGDKNQAFNIDGFSTKDMLLQIPPTFNESQYASINYKVKLFVKGKDLKILQSTTAKVQFMPRQPDYSKPVGEKDFKTTSTIRTEDIFEVPAKILNKSKGFQRAHSYAAPTPSESLRHKKSGFKLFRKTLSLLNVSTRTTTNALILTSQSSTMSSALSFVSKETELTRSSTITTTETENSLHTYFQKNDMQKSVKFKSLISSELKCLRAYPLSDIYLQLELANGGRIQSGEPPNFRIFLATSNKPELTYSYDGVKINHIYINSFSIDIIAVTKPINRLTEDKEYQTISLLKTDLDFNHKVLLQNEFFEPFVDPQTKRTVYRQQIMFDYFPSKYFWNSLEKPKNKRSLLSLAVLNIPDNITPSFTTAFVSRTHKLLISGNLQPDTLHGDKIIGNNSVKKKFVKLYDNVTVLSPLKPFKKIESPIATVEELYETAKFSPQNPFAADYDSDESLKENQSLNFITRNVNKSSASLTNSLRSNSTLSPATVREKNLAEARLEEPVSGTSYKSSRTPVYKQHESQGSSERLASKFILV